MKMISAVIPHFFRERESNLPIVIDALRNGTHPPDEILIWNNDRPISIGLPGVDIIQSHRNVGCQARFLAALAARSEFVWFQDNDVAVCERTLEEMVAWNEKLGGVTSFDGRCVPGSYRKSTLITSGPELREPHAVDITLGHGEVIRRDLLRRILSHFPFDESTVMEDLYFGWACKRAGVARWVVPTSARGGLRSLPMHGVGSCKQPGHYTQRDRICAEIFS